MARPKKQTVDYFPHYASDGKTKLILQNEFGNDGYAFWYKLLELLCESENQVYGYNNPASWRLLLAKTSVTDDIAIKILQLLADLETIDPELHKNRVIWCQNLIENLELVYKRRAIGTPEKPVIVNKKPVIVNKNRQTIQDNTKQDKTRDIPPKKNYGEFKNILLTDEEYQWLKDKLQDRTDEYIERLSGYLKSIGKDKYKSHYATILNWDRRDKEQSGKTKSRRLPNRQDYTEIHYDED